MTELVKPDREPDFIANEVWYFYWDEMVQYNPKEEICYKLIIEEGIAFFDDTHYGVKRYSDMSEKNIDYNKIIIERYNHHLFCKAVEEELDD